MRNIGKGQRGQVDQKPVQDLPGVGTGALRGSLRLADRGQMHPLVLGQVKDLSPAGKSPGTHGYG